MNDCKEIGRKIFESLLMDKKFLIPYYEKWCGQVEELRKVEEEICSTDLKSLSDEDFLKLFERFDNAYAIAYAFPLVTNSFGFFAEEHLKKLLDGRDGYITLSSPTKLSFSNECELSLLRIALRFNDDLVKEHVKRFHWVENNYTRVIYLDENYVTGAVKKIDNAEEKISKIEEGLIELKKEKERILDEIDNDELRLLVKYIDFFIHLQDQRKEFCLEALHYQYLLLNEVVRRTSYTLEELQYTMFPEIEGVLNGEVDKKVLHDRRELCFVYMKDDRKLHLETGEKAKELFDLVMPKVDVKELNGLVACRCDEDVVNGNVSVVMTMDDADKFKEGDVLVSSMTRPDMISLMKKAKLIITNEGGVTCHAAVVSRELGVPCVIGTKYATDMLKDGDKVEVDLKSGRVRKL